MRDTHRRGCTVQTYIIKSFSYHKTWLKRVLLFHIVSGCKTTLCFVYTWGHSWNNNNLFYLQSALNPHIIACSQAPSMFLSVWTVDVMTVCRGSVGHAPRTDKSYGMLPIYNTLYRHRSDQWYLKHDINIASSWASIYPVRSCLHVIDKAIRK